MALRCLQVLRMHQCNVERTAKHNSPFKNRVGRGNSTVVLVEFCLKPADVSFFFIDYLVNGAFAHVL